MHFFKTCDLIMYFYFLKDYKYIWIRSVCRIFFKIFIVFRVILMKYKQVKEVIKLILFVYLFLNHIYSIIFSYLMNYDDFYDRLKFKKTYFL